MRPSTHLTGFFTAIMLAMASGAAAEAGDSREERSHSIAVSGGMIVPWTGTVGPSFTIRVGNEASPYLRHEFEVEYRRFETDIYGYDDLPANTFTTRGLIQFMGPGEGRFNAYGGLGFGVSLIDLGRDFDSRILPGGVLSLSAIGFNLLVHGGVEYDVYPERGVNLFVEGRVDHTFTYSWVDDLDDDDGHSSNGWTPTGPGGFSFQVGVRTRF